MNKTERVASGVVDIVSHGIRVTRNQLHYAPVITLVVDTLTHVILDFSIKITFEQKNYRNRIHEKNTLLINSVSNEIPYRLTGIPDHCIENAPEFSTASFAEAMKEFSVQPKLALGKKVGGKIEIVFTLIDVLLTPSRPLWRQAHPSPKNPPFGEAWRHGGRRLPRD